MTSPATPRDDETPVIVGCRRTAIGRGDPGHGVFRRVRGDELAAAAIAAAVAAAAVDRLGAHDPRVRHRVGEDHVQGVVGEQQRQLRGAARLTLGQRAPDDVIGEQLIHVERAADRLDEHLARHAADRRKQRRAVADDAGVVGLDPQPVGPAEGDTKRMRGLGRAPCLRVPDDDAGVVGIVLGRPIASRHRLEHPPRIGAAAGEEHRGGDGPPCRP